MSIITTLEARIKVTGGATGAADIKKVGDAAKTAGAPIKTLQTDIDKLGRSTTTMGQKVSQFGQKFAGTITSVGTLGATVVNLSRQYQDLGDTQIAVEKAQKRVQSADLAVRSAKEKLAQAILKYGRGSKEATKAAEQLDLAQQQLSINTQLLTERTEDHARAQEDFWLGLGPTVAAAGSTVMSVIKDLMGPKGFGGLAAKATEAATAIGIPGKGGGGKGGGLLSSLGGFVTGGGGAMASGAAAGAVGGVAIGEYWKGKSAEVEKAGLFDLSGGPFGAKQLEQYNIIVKKTGLSIQAIQGDVEAAKKKFVELGGVLEANGQIALDQSKKVTESTKTVTTTFAGATPELMKLSAEMANYLVQGESLDQVNARIRDSGIGVAEQTFVMREAWGQFTNLLETKTNKAMTDFANNARYLDENMRPLGPLFDQMAGSLEKAQANLTASGSGLNSFIQLNRNASMTLAAYKKQVDQNIATDNIWRKGLTADIAELTGVEVSASFTKEQLMLLYEAAAESKTKFDALFATLKKGNPALWETGRAAEVTYGKLIPGSHGIPKGGRSGKMRVRSDYQRPLIGSPQAQRSMILGQRKKVLGKKHAQFGLDQILNDDTMIYAHRGERHRIEKPGGGGGGGFGGVVNVGPIILDGEVVGKRMSYKMGKNQGTYK